jgi:hypothetical protein
MSDGDRESFSNVSYHVGGDWRTYCHTYPDRAPIFAIAAGRSAVTISVPNRTADKAAVEFARAMVLDAQLFAAEMERLYAAQSDTSDDSNSKADDSGSA